MSPLRYLAIAGGLLLLGAAVPVHAGEHFNSLTNNSLTSNAVTQNALNPNALATTGSAVADLNGVAVEGISLPKDARP